MQPPSPTTRWSKDRILQRSGSLQLDCYYFRNAATAHLFTAGVKSFTKMYGGWNTKPTHLCRSSSLLRRWESWNLVIIGKLIWFNFNVSFIKFKVTQGSFWSLIEDFLTHRLATLILYSILNNGNRNKLFLNFLLLFYNLFI